MTPAGTLPGVWTAVEYRRAGVGSAERRRRRERAARGGSQSVLGRRRGRHGQTGPGYDVLGARRVQWSSAQRSCRARCAATGRRWRAAGPAEVKHAASARLRGAASHRTRADVLTCPWTFASKRCGRWPQLGARCADS